jgi:hypothetical protein
VRGFPRDREHLPDALEDWRAWFLIPGTEEHLAYSIQARSLGIHDGLCFEEIAYASIRRGYIRSAFLREDVLEV